MIITDCEFDNYDYGYNTENRQTLFSDIELEYNDHELKLPRLIFWNVNSRTLTIPMIENDNGLVLLSGFSPNIMKMVMNSKLDPYECLKETLMDVRYRIIGDIYKNDSRLIYSKPEIITKPSKSCTHNCIKCNNRL